MVSGGISLIAKLDINKWKRQFNINKDEVEDKAEKSFQLAGLNLKNLIMTYTPVGNPDLWNPPYFPHGYTPGTLRASWQIDAEKHKIIIHNDQPYAERVEKGWSTQAPEGMMVRAIPLFPKLLNEAAKEVGLIK